MPTGLYKVCEKKILELPRRLDHQLTNHWEASQEVDRYTLKQQNNKNSPSTCIRGKVVPTVANRRLRQAK